MGQTLYLCFFKRSNTRSCQYTKKSILRVLTKYNDLERIETSLFFEVKIQKDTKEEAYKTMHSLRHDLRTIMGHKGALVCSENPYWTQHWN